MQYSVFDIRNYGALGSASDDTNAIQQAINACAAAGGGLVWIPEGDFGVSSQLTLSTAKIELVGAGRGSKLRNLVTNDYCITVTAADCAVRNLLIDCESIGDGGIEHGSGSDRFVEDNVRVINSVTSTNDTGAYDSDNMIKRVKGSDETVNNADTVQDDNDLFFYVGANEVWGIEFYLSVISNSTADFIFDVSVPSGATIRTSAHPEWNTSDTLQVSSGTLPVSIGQTTTERGILLRGFIKNGSTAGLLKLKWAQSSATVVDTIVKAGSHLIAHRLA